MRRAFVTTLAVTMIALVGLALAGMTARLGTMARQTMQARERAQADELFLAAAEVLKRDPAARGVDLPAGLREAGAAVTIRPGAGGRGEIEVVVGRTRVVRAVEVSGDVVKFPPGSLSP